MTLEERMQELRELAGKFAKAEAQRQHLVEFRKSKKALLMIDAEKRGFQTSAAQEREAYASRDYIELLDGLKVATETAESARWLLKIAEMGAELWRTQQANARAERKGYGA